MIYFNFNIRNPSWWNRFENIKCWVGKTPFNHKYWEIQLIKCSNLIRLEFEWTIKQDHAGINLEIGVFGHEIHFTFYDNRHWNYEENCWLSHEEDRG